MYVHTYYHTYTFNVFVTNRVQISVMCCFQAVNGKYLTWRHSQTNTSASEVSVTPSKIFTTCSTCTPTYRRLELSASSGHKVHFVGIKIDPVYFDETKRNESC